MWVWDVKQSLSEFRRAGLDEILAVLTYRAVAIQAEVKAMKGGGKTRRGRGVVVPGQPIQWSGSSEMLNRLLNTGGI